MAVKQIFINFERLINWSFPLLGLGRDTCPQCRGLVKMSEIKRVFFNKPQRIDVQRNVAIRNSVAIRRIEIKIDSQELRQWINFQLIINVRHFVEGFTSFILNNFWQFAYAQCKKSVYCCCCKYLRVYNRLHANSRFFSRKILVENFRFPSLKIC